MNINLYNNAGRVIVKKEIMPALKGIELDYKMNIKKLGIILLSDEKLREMNVRYLKSDDYTDIISFNYSEDPIEIEGELYISKDRINENSQIYNNTYKEEMYRVIIHGVLHLAGELDEKTEQRNKMQDKENQYLRLICFT